MQNEDLKVSFSETLKSDFMLYKQEQIYIYIYIMHLADAFIPKRLYIAFKLQFFFFFYILSNICQWGMNNFIQRGKVDFSERIGRYLFLF